MLRQLVLIGILALLSSCSRDPFDPSRYLNDDEQRTLVRRMVYYTTKLPPNANDVDKFDAKYDWYYDRAADEARLLKYHRADDGDYFLLARKARSLTPMEEGIAGKLKRNVSGGLADYEEVFRMWKMPADTLNARGAMLFDRMVKGRELTIFYPKFQGDRFIELPTEGYSYDKVSKRWRSTPL